VGAIFLIRFRALRRNINSEFFRRRLECRFDVAAMLIGGKHVERVHEVIRIENIVRGEVKALIVVNYDAVPVCRPWPAVESTSGRVSVSLKNLAYRVRVVKFFDDRYGVLRPFARFRRGEPFLLRLYFLDGIRGAAEFAGGVKERVGVRLANCGYFPRVEMHPFIDGFFRVQGRWNNSIATFAACLYGDFAPGFFGLIRLPCEFLIAAGIGTAEKHLVSAAAGLLYRESVAEVADRLPPALVISGYVKIDYQESAGDSAADCGNGFGLAGAEPVREFRIIRKPGLIRFPCRFIVLSEREEFR
jgi:hypothetical protein